MTTLSDMTFNSDTAFFPHSGFRTCALKKGKSVTWKDDSLYSILFLTDGKGVICDKTGKKVSVINNQMIMIRRSQEFIFTANEKSRFILFLFESLPAVCDTQFYNTLFEEVIDVEYEFNPYPVCPAIQKFLILLDMYVEDGIQFNEIYSAKLYELFSLLRFYYSKKDLIQLLHPLLNASHKFRQMVLENASKVSGARELMELCGMKRTSFERRFKEEFGVSAHQWVLKQKAEAVGQSLSELNISIEEVRRRHRFNSATHFVRFCRQQFHCTPSEYRREIKKNIKKTDTRIQE